MKHTESAFYAVQQTFGAIALCLVDWQILPWLPRSCPEAEMNLGYQHERSPEETVAALDKGRGAELRLWLIAAASAASDGLLGLETRIALFLAPIRHRLASLTDPLSCGAWDCRSRISSSP